MNEAGRLAVALEQCSSLANLDLAARALGWKGQGGWRGLGYCSSLVHLDLSGNGIADEGRAVLSAAVAGSRFLLRC